MATWPAMEEREREVEVCGILEKVGFWKIGKLEKRNSCGLWKKERNKEKEKEFNKRRYFLLGSE